MTPEEMDVLGDEVSDLLTDLGLWEEVSIGADEDRTLILAMTETTTVTITIVPTGVAVGITLATTLDRGEDDPLNAIPATQFYPPEVTAKGVADECERLLRVAERDYRAALAACLEREAANIEFTTLKAAARRAEALRLDLALAEAYETEVRGQVDDLRERAAAMRDGNK